MLIIVKTYTCIHTMTQQSLDSDYLTIAQQTEVASRAWKESAVTMVGDDQSLFALVLSLNRHLENGAASLTQVALQWDCYRVDPKRAKADSTRLLDRLCAAESGSDAELAEFKQQCAARGIDGTPLAQSYRTTFNQMADVLDRAIGRVAALAEGAPSALPSQGVDQGFDGALFCAADRVSELRTRLSEERALLEKSLSGFAGFSITRLRTDGSSPDFSAQTEKWLETGGVLPRLLISLCEPAASSARDTWLEEARASSSLPPSTPSFDRVIAQGYAALRIIADAVDSALKEISAGIFEPSSLFDHCYPTCAIFLHSASKIQAALPPDQRAELTPFLAITTMALFDMTETAFTLHPDAALELRCDLIGRQRSLLRVLAEPLAG